MRLLFPPVLRPVYKQKYVRVHRYVRDTVMSFANDVPTHEVVCFPSEHSHAVPDTDFVSSLGPDASDGVFVDHCPFVSDSNSHSVGTLVEIVLDELDHTQMVVSSLRYASLFLPHSTLD